MLILYIISSMIFMDFSLELSSLIMIGCGMIAGIIGGIIGVMYLNNTYKNQKSLEEEIGLTVIGAIPKID